MMNIPLNELPSPYDFLIELVGIEKTVKIAEEFGGENVYFRKLDTLVRDQKNTYIAKEFNGHNHRELAKKYNVTPAWIAQLVKNKHKERR
jgi:Mor family transcriptional regulator